MRHSHKIIRSENHIPSFGTNKVVFTNGCFDILHPGHLTYLNEAKELGDILIVGLNSDDSISKIKGADRPINDFHFRSTMLSFFDFIDLIIEFDQETPESLIRNISPDILVKGSDYSEMEIVGAELVNSSGGRVVLIDFMEGFSTSNIINKIKASSPL